MPKLRYCILFLIVSSLHGQHTTTTTDSQNTTRQESPTMHGMYGRYPMSRELSGTSWQPEATPMAGPHTMYHDWFFMLHGYLNLIYDDQRGPRGGKKFLNTSMFDANTQHDFDRFNTLGFRTMFSLEPFMGPAGYPLLLQTGETADGKTPLIDRQHPHNLVLELAIAYSIAIKNNQSFFMYFGLPGEPALGPPPFVMRYSAVYNPEAPISHHWQDSTHYVFGVFTLGYIWDKFKIDASIFTGREPDQHRWSFNKPRFDSYSIRTTYNPLPQLSFQVSYGFLKSPEQLTPDVNIHRITASAAYHHHWSTNNNWQTFFCWGRNINRPGPITDAFLLETTCNINNRHIIFGRFVRVYNDDLFMHDSPFFHQIFGVNKATAGYIFAFLSVAHLQWGIGALGSLPIVPAQLKPYYGSIPFSYMIFLQIQIV